MNVILESRRVVYILVIKRGLANHLSLKLHFANIAEYYSE